MESECASGSNGDGGANSNPRDEGKTPLESYEPSDKAQDPKYHDECVKVMDGKDFNLRYVQREGFDTPIVVKSKKGLHIAVPKPSFGVMEVRACFGSTRLVSVVDMKTQVVKQMTMRNFHRYWATEKGNSNMLVSLKFSHTRMEQFVTPPLIVRQLDWVDRAWPRNLKLMQTKSSEVLHEMMYPEVQKYVTMAMKGCFTDFMINPGGAAAWYHVLHGKVVFFLFPSTNENIRAFLIWQISEKQRELFLGDMVDQCGRVTIEAGQTFFLPSGWIHAMYMPEKSLVFNGKFLHSFGVKKQCRIACVEEAMKVPRNLRFPFFIEMLWYYLEGFVNVLTGKSFIPGGHHKCLVQGDPLGKKVVAGDEKITAAHGGSENVAPKHHPQHVHLTTREVAGLRTVLAYLRILPPSLKVIPHEITDPGVLLGLVYQLMKDHENDDQELAITGTPLLLWPDEVGSMAEIEEHAMSVKHQQETKSPVLMSLEVEKTGEALSRRPFVSPVKQNPDVLRRKRQRCKVCEGCLAENCRVCVHCHDMRKYGGAEKLKKPCVDRRCKNMMVPAICVCNVCAKRNCEEYPNDPSGGLFECVSCGGIAHESCMALQFPDFQSQMVKEKDKEWLCRKCVADIAASFADVTNAPAGAASGEKTKAVGHSPSVNKKPRGRPKGWRKPKMEIHPETDVPSPPLSFVDLPADEADFGPVVAVKIENSGIHVTQPSIEKPASPLPLLVQTEEQTAAAGVDTIASSVSPVQEPSIISVLRSFRFKSFERRAGQTTAVHNNGDENPSGQPNLEETTGEFGHLQL